jgi:hypothetical protein
MKWVGMEELSDFLYALAKQNKDDQDKKDGAK